MIKNGAMAAATASEAVAASTVTITCVKSHPQTIEIMRNAENALPGKTIIELSTGGAAAAEELAKTLEDAGAKWMVGIINAYPHMIGDEATVLTVVGTEEQWAVHGPIIKVLGGGSIHVGDRAGMLAALFAGLFTVRQGFMWGTGQHDNGELSPDIKTPAEYSALCRTALKLSSQMDFVRCDLYLVEGQVYFSEMTLYGAGGYVWENFAPADEAKIDEQELNQLFTEVWDLRQSWFMKTPPERLAQNICSCPAYTARYRRVNSPIFPDTVGYHFLLPVEPGGRQHPVSHVFGFWIAAQLDIINHILPGFFARA